MTPRAKNPSGSPTPPCPQPWMAGAMIGLAIFTLASSAAVLGAGVALGEAVVAPAKGSGR